jgi:hypothetical protein
MTFGHISHLSTLNAHKKVGFEVYPAPPNQTEDQAKEADPLMQVF